MYVAYFMDNYEFFVYELLDDSWLIGSILFFDYLGFSSFAFLMERP